MKKAIIPISIIIIPDIKKDVLSPMVSAINPIPIKPSIAGMSATVKYIEKTLPSAEGSIFVCSMPVKAEL